MRDLLSRGVALGLIASLALAAPGGAQSAPPVPAATPTPTPSLHASAHRTVSTAKPEAQAAYDRGLVLLYAFNMGEARVSFARAATIDPDCAMAFYGQALTEVTDINVDPDADNLSRGRADMVKAAAAGEATPDERALIAALTLRFAPAKNDAVASAAYSRSMRAYAAAHPSDVDGTVEAAFAIWQGQPSSDTDPDPSIGALLDRAIAADPNQFGAHHLRIHFEEESHRPADALSDADFLASAIYDPGESHLPHMAGHIFVRLGNYAAATDANERAIANDATYFAEGNGPGQTYMKHYHDHDLDFVLFGLTTLGRNDEARAVAQREDIYARTQVALRLHDWNAVLASGTTSSSALAIANARLGNEAAARKSFKTPSGNTTPRAIAALTAYVDGSLARVRGDKNGAVKGYATAYKDRPSDLGDPKIAWATPIGEAYAAALLRVGRFADAESVFSDELRRYPNDPRLLFGRAYALEGEHRDGSADRAAAQAIWQGATIPGIEDLG